MNKSFGLALLSVVTGCVASCASEDKADDGTDAIMPTTGPTGTMPTTTMPTGTGSNTTVPPGSSPPAPATVAPTPPAGGNGGGGGGPAAVTSPFPSCGSTSYSGSNGDNMTSALDGGRSIYFFGDATTTGCGDLMQAGKACLYGETDTSAVGENMYMNWGAGMGLQLAQTDANGVVVAPFDAAALGIAGVKFTVSSFFGRPTRVQLSQVDDPAITDAAANYSQNGFVWGGSSPESISTDGEQELMFEDFELPSWTGILDAEGMPAAGQALDPTKLHSLQFQIANNPDDPMTPYGFCIGPLTWIDAAGAPVTVGLPMDTGGGGAGGMGGAGGGAGGGGGAPGGAGGGGGAPGGAGGAAGGGGAPGGAGGGGGAPGGAGGAGGGGGDAPTFADVHAIFTAKCTPCHADMMSGGRSHGLADAMAAYASASTMPEEIVDRITREDGAMGKMPPAMGEPLTEDEIATITAWVEAGAPE